MKIMTGTLYVSLRDIKQESSVAPGDFSFVCVDLKMHSLRVVSLILFRDLTENYSLGKNLSIALRKLL